MLPDVGVLALVPDEWGIYWEPRHHVLTRLARYFHVVWVNPADAWQNTLTVLRARLKRECIDIAQPPGFRVYTPDIWLPELYRYKRLAELSFQWRLRRARRLLTKVGCRKIILYLWRPDFERALSSIPFDLSCYHIDDEYSFSPVELPPNEAEMRLIAAADQVFIHSPELLKKKGTINPNTAFLPNGVSYQEYAQAAPEPPDMNSIPHPRIGYSGFIKRQLDWALLSQLAQHYPQWSFVFVGPMRPHAEVPSAIEEFATRSNVYFLGGKTVRALASYPQHFDVCIMPYRVNDYTRYIYPLKLHEYLASGRPVVGTRIPSLEEFADIIALPTTYDEWSAAIGRALEPEANTIQRREARQAVAQQYDWEVLVERIARAMADRLGKDFIDRLAKLLSDH